MWHPWRYVLRVAESKQAYTLSSLLVSWHAAEICRSVPLVMCSQPLASVQGENVF